MLDAQEPRRLRKHALGIIHGSNQKLPLNPIQMLVQREAIADRNIENGTLVAVFLLGGRCNEITRFQDIAIAHNGRLHQGTMQLPNVASPRMTPRKGDGRLRKRLVSITRLRAGELRVDLMQKRLSQQWDVRSAFAKRRKFQGDYG